MASGPLLGGGGGGGGGGDGSREKHKWADSKVYTRKAHKSTSKPNSNPNPNPLPQQQQQQQAQQTLATSVDDVGTSSQQPPSNHHQNHQEQPLDRSNSNEQASSPNANTNNNNFNSQRPPLISHRLENGEHCVTINLASRSRHEVHELRCKLEEELEKVRALYRKLEAREVLLASASAAPVSVPGYSHSQLSANGAHPVSAAKKAEGTHSGPLRRHLNVSVATGQPENYSVSDGMEKEKRTPKANQYYRNSEFLLAKDKFPPPDSHKKSKSNGSKKHSSGQGDYGSSGLEKLYAHAFKSCGALLSKMMKHKHGWVFNTPVDVKGLGLHDYYSIIKHPMDLGTVKSRLSTNWYKSPREFAEDVRLTFRNAMTYNPKGQDVHIMAEQLSSIFEERWPAIEAEFAAPSYPMVSKKAPPPPLDMRRILERSESTTHPMVPDSTPKTSSYTPLSGRAPALKKPKAKDPHKRDMTYDEKQRLSNHLQNLPSEKLDMIVQIIKKRNSALSQHDDEIEVDIDSVDTETLWELDRFVTNYKKSLSKHKRKAELAIQARQAAEQNAQERNLQNQTQTAAEVPMESNADKNHMGSSSPPGEQKKDDDESRSSSSCSSSSDSGSSSSDSDSDSSSG